MSMEGLFWKDSFSGKNRAKAYIFLCLGLILFFAGLMIPKISYDSFCVDFTDVSEVRITKQFKNPVDVFKSTLCRAESEIEERAVEYLLYPYYFSARAFLWYLASMQLIFFMRERKTMMMDGVALAVSFFFWTVSLLIYLSVYTGWL